MKFLFFSIFTLLCLNSCNTVYNHNINCNFEHSELSIEISDVSGSVITTKNIMMKQGEIQLQFKMSSYSNGNYYYVVKQNGKQVSNGAFSIVK